MKGKQANIGQLLVAMFMVAVLMTSSFGALAQGAVESGRPVIARTVPLEVEEQELEKPFGIPQDKILPPFFQMQFSGSGAIESGNNAESIKIIARKDNRVYPIFATNLQDEARILSQTASILGIPKEDLESSVTTIASGTEAEKLTAARPVRIRDDIWSGQLIISTGNFQENYFLIGKEKGSEIEFAVIPIGKYPVEINKLVVSKEIYLRIEIWKGKLDIISDSNFEGDWKLTAFSHRPAFRGQPIPLEIERGSEAAIGNYVIKPIEIKRSRIFGFIPMGEETAVIEIYKYNKLVSTQTLTEDETAVIDDLTLRVIKINGVLKVIAETEDRE